MNNKSLPKYEAKRWEVKKEKIEETLQLGTRIRDCILGNTSFYWEN